MPPVETFFLSYCDIYFGNIMKMTIEYLRDNFLTRTHVYRSIFSSIGSRMKTGQNNKITHHYFLYSYCSLFFLHIQVMIVIVNIIIIIVIMIIIIY
mgnify:CR=1 FL=1